MVRPGARAAPTPADTAAPATTSVRSFRGPGSSEANVVGVTNPCVTPPVARISANSLPPYMSGARRPSSLPH
ncbi:hypothetical protein GS426_04125 [Rhodococcus hoagii]|nr:hypothetical protein [Prescottella equi]